MIFKEYNLVKVGLFLWHINSCRLFNEKSSIYLSTYLSIYLSIYIYVCVCVCVICKYIVYR